MAFDDEKEVSEDELPEGAVDESLDEDEDEDEEEDVPEEETDGRQWE